MKQANWERRRQARKERRKEVTQGERKTHNGRSRGGETDCQQGRRTRDSTGRLKGQSRMQWAPSRENQVYRAANHIISCLPYGFRGTWEGKGRKQNVSQLTLKTKKIWVTSEKCENRNLVGGKSVSIHHVWCLQCCRSRAKRTFVPKPW